MSHISFNYLVAMPELLFLRNASNWSCASFRLIGALAVHLAAFEQVELTATGALLAFQYLFIGFFLIGGQFG